MTTEALEQQIKEGPLAQYSDTTSTSLTLHPETPYEGWHALIGVLGEVGRGVLWWSGDALLQGETFYGEKYAQAMNILHADYQTVANRVWVSRKVPPEIRRDDLSWTHHQVVAGLPSQTLMIEWLAKAAKNGWDSKTLAKEIKKSGRATGDRDGGAHKKKAAPNVGPLVEAAVRDVLRKRVGAVRKPGEWAAKVFAKKALFHKEVQSWAKAIRAHVERALDA